jgi:hypothetical protein
MMIKVLPKDRKTIKLKPHSFSSSLLAKRREVVEVIYFILLPVLSLLKTGQISDDR